MIFGKVRNFRTLPKKFILYQNIHTSWKISSTTCRGALTKNIFQTKKIPVFMVKIPQFLIDIKEMEELSGNCISRKFFYISTTPASFLANSLKSYLHIFSVILILTLDNFVSVFPFLLEPCNAIIC